MLESLKDDAISVENLKQLVQNNVVNCGLAFIQLHLSELFINLTNLEELNSELLVNINIFRKIEGILTNIAGPNGKQKLKINLYMLLKKIKGIQLLNLIKKSCQVNQT